MIASRCRASWYPKGWRRHVASAAVLGFFLALNTATSPAHRTPLPPWDAGGPAVDASVTDAGADSVAALLEPDVGSIRALIGCVAAKKDGCRVFDDFDAGALPKTAALPKERVVFFGKAYGVGGNDDGKTHWSYLVVENSGRKGALLFFDEADGADAGALYGRVSKGVAGGTSAALSFMKSVSPPDGFHPLLPAAVSLRIRSTVPAYVRQSGDRWIVLEYSGAPIEVSGGKKALAWVSELWQVK